MTGIPGNIDEAEGLGLNIMQYRARIIGASVYIQKSEKGGTELLLKFEASV